MDKKEQQLKAYVPTEEVNDDDDDEGPPPGFQCIITPQPQPKAAEIHDDDDDGEDNDDDEGPPPGFDSIAAKPLTPPSLPASHDMATSNKGDDDDDDGPPPGWEFSTLANALPKPQSNMTDTKPESTKEIDDNEDEDDGPPPGWETVLPHQRQLPCAPPLQPSSAVSYDTEMGSKQKIARNDDEVLPSGSQSVPMPVQPLLIPPPSQQQPSSEVPSDIMNKREDANGGKRPMSGNQHATPPKQLPPTPSPMTPPLAPSSSEKAQLVCGTCRKLCLFPRGAKWVKCPGCQEVNFALEAHEVGQVKCGGCAVLLMYPHGAPAVQCSTCRCVTQIGAHNQRPPLSVQQAQRRRRLPRRAR